MSSMEDKEWPLDVMSRDSRGNWKKRVPVTIDPNDGSHKPPHATGKPLGGCIVVKRFRLRILLGGSKKDTSNKMDHQAPKKKRSGEENTMEVVRRGNCILLSSKQRQRALLLKFTSVRDCLEFSDRLLELNPSLNLALTANGPVVAAPNAEEPKKTLMGMIQAQEEELQAQEEQRSSNIDALSSEIQSNNMYSFMVRLLHDPAFMSFVDSLEKRFVSRPDGAKLLLEAISSSSTTASPEETLG